METQRVKGYQGGCYHFPTWLRQQRGFPYQRRCHDRLACHVRCPSAPHLPAFGGPHPLLPRNDLSKEDREDSAFSPTYMFGHNFSRYVHIDAYQDLCRLGQKNKNMRGCGQGLQRSPHLPVRRVASARADVSLPFDGQLIVLFLPMLAVLIATPFRYALIWAYPLHP
jgi:hypothetical protein